MKIAAAVLVFMSMASAHAQAPETAPKDFWPALTAATKLHPKKSEFETWDDFSARVRVDCAAAKSPICEPVKIVKTDIFFNYSPEREVIEFYDFSVFTKGYGVMEGLEPSKKDAPECVVNRILSTKQSSYSGTNGFGVQKTVSKRVLKAAGLIFRSETSIPWGWAGGEEMSSATFLACYDEPAYWDGTKHEARQIIHVSKADAKLEAGKFLVELVGLPASPYVVSAMRFHLPTLDDPNDGEVDLTALLVKPIQLRFIGAVTGKVYSEFSYQTPPNSSFPP